MSKTALFQEIQFSIRTKFSSIWLINRTLSDATTPNQSGPGSEGNEGVLRIPQNSSITGTSSLDFFVQYPGHSLGVVLPLCRGAVVVFYSLKRLARFKESCEEGKDDARSRRPSKRWADFNVEVVRQLVCGDGQLTVRKISWAEKKDNVWKIVTEDLSIRKV